MSIIQQIRGDLLPAQSSGIPAGLQISPTGNSEFGKNLPSESAEQSPNDATRLKRLANNSPPPDLSGGVGTNSPIQMDVLHSMQSARAYALNSIMDVLVKGAVGTIV